MKMWRKGLVWCMHIFISAVQIAISAKRPQNDITMKTNGARTCTVKNLVISSALSKDQKWLSRAKGNDKNITSNWCRMGFLRSCEERAPECINMLSISSTKTGHLDRINQSLCSSGVVTKPWGSAPPLMSVRVRSSLTNKRLRSGKSGAAPGTDHPVGGRTAETIIQSCQGLRRTGGGKGAEEKKIQLGLMVMVNLEILRIEQKRGKYKMASARFEICRFLGGVPQGSSLDPLLSPVDVGTSQEVSLVA